MNRKALRLFSLLIFVIGFSVAALNLLETDSLIFWLGGCLLSFGLSGFAYSEAFMFLPKERHITSRWYARGFFFMVLLASIGSVINLTLVAMGA
jgi:uncharacterized BrkB/YihY/UPF0761 family membrane protein